MRGIVRTLAALCQAPRMAQPDPATKPEVDVWQRTSMAAERTWLAWWRTALTATAGALAVGRFAPELLDVAPWPYVLLGGGYALLAVALLVFGALRQRGLERSIVNGVHSPLPFGLVAGFTIGGVLLVTLTVVLVGVQDASFGLGLVQGHGGANESLQRLLVDLVAFVEVDGAPGVAFEAGVEEARRILQRGALGEGHLHDVLVGLAGADHPVVLPHRNASPLPLLDHLGVGFLIRARSRESISPRQSPSSLILASISCEALSFMTADAT